MGQKKVLIVEDEIMIATLYMRMLERSGYHVLDHAESGEKAIESVKEIRPDLILMDIFLGTGIDGVDAAREIIAIDKEIAIIFVSGFDDKSTKKRIKELGNYRLVAKPVKVTTLIEIVEEEMSEKKGDD